MSFILLLILIFSAIFQPGVVWPGLEVYRPFFVIALISIIGTVFYAMTHKRKSPSPVEYKLLIGLAAMETISVVQYFWLGEIFETFMFWIKMVIIFFSITYNVDSFQKVKQVLWICVLAVSLVSVISYHNYTNPEIPVLEYREQETESEFEQRAYLTYLRANQLVRIGGYGMYSGANDFALMLTICFPFIFKLFELDRNIIKRLYLISLVPFMYYLLLLTVSRGGVLGTSMVTALSVYSVRKIKSIANSQVFKTIFIGILIVGVLAVMVAKLSQRSDATSMLGGDRSSGDRLKAWFAGARMLAKNPLTGVGYNYFPLCVRDYGGPVGIQAHNTIVKVAAETGFIGIFCYLGLLYLSFKKLYSMMKYYINKGDDDRAVLIQAVLIALAGFFFNTLFSVKEHEWLLYILLGLSTAMHRIYLEEADFSARFA